ncbi:Wzz/FepE/Etk N-terminal domain-containing protein [Bacillus sp. V5-8f]|uniref:Wzz/FepE/Etk N-terminal domain-containing protein n=1 Tax=Bacillus sp. V5-8f TaxID=2053044 RepID=UPI000C763E90|nr:Wzz/FepE/Etk N-terminal domain-containing protein [Bacillus sp. V5-8f]PLT35720.1 hypothetical protein CUU64_00105 [Bacillus sp. V5-8f]
MFKGTISRILNRLRKLAILLILIPILTAAIAYIYESRQPVTYSAEAQVELGNFENEGLTDPRKVQKIVQSDAFLNNINAGNKLNETNEAIKQRLTVETSETKTVTLQYQSEDKKKAEAVLSAVVDGFIARSDDLFQRKYNFIKNQVDAVKEIETTTEQVKQQEFIRENEFLLQFDYKKNQIVEDVQVSQDPHSPLSRAIFGLIIGIMVSIIILILPEIFRSYEE